MKLLHHRIIPHQSFPTCAMLALLIAAPTAVVEAGHPVETVVVRTTPVGLATIRIPARSSRAIALPLSNHPICSGVVAGVQDTKIIPANLLCQQARIDAGNQPMLLRMLSGSAQGRVAAVVAWNPEFMEVDPNFGALLATGDRFELFPADTLAGVFGGSDSVLQPGNGSDAADRVMVHDGAAWRTFYHNGSHWVEDGRGSEVMDDFPLLPDHGVFVALQSRSRLVLTVAGEVPVAGQASALPANATRFLGNPFPVNTRLADLQFEHDPSWRSGNSIDTADQVLVFNGRQWQAFYHDGSAWRNEKSKRRNPMIQKSSAVVVKRLGGSDVLHSPKPPYQLD